MARTGTRPLRVALADDTPEIRQALRLSLEFDGRFEVVGEAGDGEQAVRLATQEQPHVVLLDLAMPVMDGLQAIPHIKQAAPSTRIVVLSGFTAEKMSKEALERGADRYVVKGLAFSTLADDLLELCGWDPVPADEPPEELSLTGEDRLAALVHELHRPLRAIQGLAGALRAAADDVEPALVVTVADALTRSSHTIERLLADLVDNPRGLRLAWIQSDLGTLVNQELEAMAHATVGRPLVVSVPEAVPVRCDPARVRQILGTLVSNAVEHTPAESPIEVVLTAGGGLAEVSVRDFGPGIPPAQADGVFDGPRAGRGLGLFVSRALADAHGGGLRLELPEDGGCRFVLTLPLD